MDPIITPEQVDEVINANNEHKMDLLLYIEKLQKELDSVDALIQAAETHMDVPDDMESDEELPNVVFVPDAISASPPVSSDALEDLSSPFFETSQRHIRVNELTSARHWTDAENAALKDAVQREGMRYHALQLQSQGINPLQTLKDVPLSAYSEIRDNIDWERVARFIPGRLPSSCRVQWLSHEHPGVQRAPWTDQERQDLKRAVDEARRASSQQNGVDDEDIKDVDWEIVAGYLGNGRVAADCLKAYRAVMSKAMPVTWTPHLDKELLDAVAQYGENNMTTVAMSMSIILNRSQCSNRYSYLKTSSSRGKWSSEEDALLRDLVSKYPEDIPDRWIRIANEMGTRNQRQCRDRWSGVLDLSLKRDHWTDEEDKIIQEAVQNSQKPGDIAKRLNRPVGMVRNRMTAFKAGTVPSKRVNRTASRANVIKPKASSDRNSIGGGTEPEPATTKRNDGQSGSSDSSRSGSPSLASSGPRSRLSNVGVSASKLNPNPDGTPNLDSDSDSNFEPELSVREARELRLERQKEDRQEALGQMRKEAVRKAVTEIEAGSGTVLTASDADIADNMHNSNNNAGSLIAPNPRRTGRGKPKKKNDD